jgi:hypothetical protein
LVCIEVISLAGIATFLPHLSIQEKLKQKYVYMCMACCPVLNLL